MDWANVYLIPLVAVLSVVGLIWYFRIIMTSQVDKHPMLCEVRWKSLPYDSPSRLRLQKAHFLFDEGWKMLKSSTPLQSLEWFAKAVEIDELACGWKSKFEQKMEMIGDLFAIPMSNTDEKYSSMMVEAYFIVLLNTVIQLYGKPQSDEQEDFNVVKTRMDVCAKLQPNNPAVYKLRADWQLKFGALADKAAAMSDYQKAISLLDAATDTEDHQVALHGLELEVQRSYLLAYCHYQLAGLLHRGKKMSEAKEHYQKAIDAADEHFRHLPDACFSLCIVILLDSTKLDDHSAATISAIDNYQQGIQAEKRVLKYLPASGGEISRKLAKHLIKKHTAAVQKAAAQGSNKKED